MFKAIRFVPIPFVLLVAAPLCAEPSPPTAPPGAAAALAAAPATEKVCAGTVRPGWAMIDDARDVMPGCPDNGGYNVWVIEKLDDLPVGSSLEICRQRVVPIRWYLAQSKWDGGRCGHPAAKDADNIMVIRRAH